VSLDPVSSTAVRKELRSSDENPQDRRHATAMDTGDSNLEPTPFDDGELYDVLWIYKSEMELLLRVAGFARWEIYGDFDRRPLLRETDAMVVEAWKS
jgi:hypothetical protein